MSNLYGIKMLLPARAKNRLSTAATTKLYLVDERGETSPVELKSASSFEIKETGADGVLTVTITFPLFDIGYDIATTAEEIKAKMAELRKSQE